MDYLRRKGYTFRNNMSQKHIFIHPYGRYAFCFYVIPSVVVFLICLRLHNSGFSNYLKTHTYQCRVVGGYKRSGHMYLILQEVNSNKIFSIDASPEDYHIYHNKPGTILTYTFKEYFIAPNKTYDLYRIIFLTGVGLLVTFLFLFGTIDISEEMASTLMITTLILLGTSILSYNFVI